MMASFYRDTVCLNVLAKSVQNATEIYKKTEGNVLIGLLSSNYSTVEAASKDIQEYSAATNGAISIGLGGGNPEQWKMVSDIVQDIQVTHINQVFPAVGYTRAVSKNKDAWINGLVQPTSKLGYVNIATGPQSTDLSPVNVPVQTAITFLREMGGNALKLFPLNGLQHKEHYQRIAEICAEEDFPLEPTGGITLDNFAEIISIAKDAGVKKLIPHVYSSIIDQSSGWTCIQAVEKLYASTKTVL